ncbi:MAG: hypothetical protein ACREK5_07370 [Gemmatimonadota bacterium]
MAKDDRSKRPDKPKRQPEPDPQSGRKGGRTAEEQGRQWPADKEGGKGRRGEKPK